jgi:hypothetical protein
MTPYSAPTTRTSSRLDRWTHYNDELALIEHAFSREIVGQCELALAVAEANAAQIAGTVEAAFFLGDRTRLFLHISGPSRSLSRPAPGASSATTTKSASPLTHAGRSRCRLWKSGAGRAAAPLLLVGRKIQSPLR